MALEVLTQKKA